MSTDLRIVVIRIYEDLVTGAWVHTEYVNNLVNTKHPYCINHIVAYT